MPNNEYFVLKSGEFVFENSDESSDLFSLGVGDVGDEEGGGTSIPYNGSGYGDEYGFLTGNGGFVCTMRNGDGYGYGIGF